MLGQLACSSFSLMSPVPAFSLILILVSYSSVSRQSSMNSKWLLTYRMTPPPHLPCLSFLQSLYPFITVFQSWKPSSQVYVVSIRSQPWRPLCVSSFSCLLSMLCVSAERHLCWPADEADLLPGVAGIPLSCCSDAFLLTCDPFTDSELLLLARALNW